MPRGLLADTGAGDAYSGFDLLLKESDCLLCGQLSSQAVVLGGSYTGTFRVYVVRTMVPALAFDHFVRAVGVPTVPVDFDGIASFRFLSRFTYGNFGNLNQFGLEV
jgi:hypothetical protein